MAMTNFYKEHFKKGQTVYLLRIGDEARRTVPENWIFPAVVKTVGRKYITVSNTVRDIRFEYDEAKEEIWHDTPYSQDYELYLTKADVEKILEKRAFQREILQQINKIRCMELTELPLEQLHLLKQAITDIPVMSEIDVKRCSGKEYQAFLWNIRKQEYCPVGQPVSMGSQLLCKKRLDERIAKKDLLDFEDYDILKYKICTRTVYPIITNWKNVEEEK